MGDKVYTSEDLSNVALYVMESTRMVAEHGTTFDSMRGEGLLEGLEHYKGIDGVDTAINVLSDSIASRKGIKDSEYNSIRSKIDPIINELAERWDPKKARDTIDRLTPIAVEGNYASGMIDQIEIFSKREASKAHQKATGKELVL